VFPINSCNWSHAPLDLAEPLNSLWRQIPEHLEPGDLDKQSKLRAQLDALVRFDMARVSPEQLEILRKIVNEGSATSAWCSGKTRLDPPSLAGPELARGDKAGRRRFI